jgi:RimJ/RimL family protein N-acetyltransferase
VINGDNEGKMWIDDPKNPKTGVLVDNEYSIYLVGDSSNSDLNKEISNLIHNKILLEARKIAEQLGNEWVIFYDHDNWKKIFEQDMKIVDYLPLKRKYYLLEQYFPIKWREKIPTGYSMNFIDFEFLNRKNLKNFNKVTDYIKHSWKSKEDFLNRGFGFCLVKDNTILTSWCIADWVTNGKTEIGVETDENFRRKGHAMLVSSAAVDYCWKNNIKVGWHCSSHNIASQKVAEAVGFNLAKEYDVIMGSFDKAHLLWENAWYRGLFLNRPEEGIRYMNKFLELRDADASQLYYYGIILVKAGKLKEALSIFSDIVKMKPNFVRMMRDTLINEEEFQNLRELEGWKELVKKLDNSK